MQKGNYYVPGFLNIEEKSNRSLWIAGEPKDVQVKEGVVVVLVPFYQQGIQFDDVIEVHDEVELRELKFSAYGDEVLRLTLDSNNLNDVDNPMLQFAEGFKKTDLKVEQRENQWIIIDGKEKVRALIDCKDPEINFWSDLIEAPAKILSIDFYPDGTDKVVSLSSEDQFFPKRKGSSPISYLKEDNKIVASTIAFHANHNECFSGTGERFAKLDLSGQTVELQNQDGQGVNNRRTYKNIPFYVSSRMYGVFLNTHAHCKISFADHSTRAVDLYNENDSIDAFIIGGDSLEKIQKHYREITGFPQKAPLWSYGIWMSKMTYESAKEINKVVDRLQNDHYPFDVIHIDTGWFRVDWLCEWKFNLKTFPDPPAFVKGLKDQGIRVSLWQMPYVAKEAVQCDEAIKNKFIGRPKTERKESNSNFGVLDYEGTIDFTNPSAVEWYKNFTSRAFGNGSGLYKDRFRGRNPHGRGLSKHGCCAST